MPAKTPADLPKLFLDAVSRHDPDALASLLEANAVAAPDPAFPITGRAAIRALAAGLFQAKPQPTLESAEVVQAGDLALIRARVIMRITGSEGATHELRVTPTLVARRQPDSTWLVAIGRPVFG